MWISITSWSAQPIIQNFSSFRQCNATLKQKKKKNSIIMPIHLLGSNRHQSPIVSLKNLGDGCADSLATVCSDCRRGSGRCRRFAIAIDIVIVIISARWRNRRAGAFRFDVIHLHPLGRNENGKGWIVKSHSRIRSVLPIYRARHVHPGED